MLLWLTVYFSQTKYLRSGKKKYQLLEKDAEQFIKMP